MASKLTPKQEHILRTLATFDGEKQGLPSASELSSYCGQQLRDWAAGGLVALEARGLVEKVGLTSGNARTWRVTPAGRQALTDTREAPRG